MFSGTDDINKVQSIKMKLRNFLDALVHISDHIKLKKATSVIREAYLEPSRISMMELFCENS